MPKYPLPEIKNDHQELENVGRYSHIKIDEHIDEELPKARLALANNQNNLANNTWVKVALDNETFNVGCKADVTSGRVTINKAGYYLVIGQIAFTSVVADKRYFTAIYVNGVDQPITAIHASVAASLYVNTQDVLYLSIDDYVELYAKQISGGNLVDIAGTTTYTFLNVIYLK